MNVGFLAGGLRTTSHGQMMADVNPPDLAQWGLHCFCLGARRTPHRAICSDSSGVILYQARNGVTRAALAAQGIPCSDSQVALLEMLGVLSVSGDELRASMPICGTAPMTRRGARTCAAPLARPRACSGLRAPRAGGGGPGRRS
jgi:hypothetical protein